MRSGEMKHRVQIYRPSTVKNEFGEAEYVLWNGDVYCSVLDMDSQESVLGGDIVADVTARFKTRYSRAIEMEYQDMIIVFRGREYEIIGVRNRNFMDKELLITGIHYASRKRVNVQR